MEWMNRNRYRSSSRMRGEFRRQLFVAKTVRIFRECKSKSMSVSERLRVQCGCTRVQLRSWRDRGQCATHACRACRDAINGRPLFLLISSQAAPRLASPRRLPSSPPRHDGSLAGPPTCPPRRIWNRETQDGSSVLTRNSWAFHKGEMLASADEFLADILGDIAHRLRSFISKCIPFWPVGSMHLSSTNRVIDCF